MKKYILEKKIDGSWFKAGTPFKEEEIASLAHVAFLLGKWNICDDVRVIEEKDND